MNSHSQRLDQLEKKTFDQLDFPKEKRAPQVFIQGPLTFPIPAGRIHLEAEKLTFSDILEAILDFYYQTRITTKTEKIDGVDYSQKMGQPLISIINHHICIEIFTKVLDYLGKHIVKLES